MSLPEAEIGIVVPTLGLRPEYLEQSLRSIRRAGRAQVYLVSPATFDSKDLLQQGLVDFVLSDPGGGLAAAINFGVAALPESAKYVNWLGDDDLLRPGSLDATSAALTSDPLVVAVYGACDYIDKDGSVIWTNRSGSWARSILRFGPDLIPQPGALVRRSAFEAIGGLSNSFGWAFDFDMFIKLSKKGELKYVPSVLAAFRWHPDSLSVGQRKKSVMEASQVRKAHLPGPMKFVSELWETPVRLATYWAGVRVSKVALHEKVAK